MLLSFLRILALAVCCGVAAGVAVQGTGKELQPAPQRPASVSIEVPAAPVPVPAAGGVVLVYELHITNNGSHQLRLEQVNVRDSSRPATAIATYGKSELARNTKLIGPRGAQPPKALMPGVLAVFYVWMTFDTPTVIPKALTHHVAFADGSTVDGAPVTVRPATDLMLASPVGAGDWWIGLGPSNTSEHRRAVIRVGEDPVPHLAQRFAIDWVKMDAKNEYARDRRGRRNEDWYGYGESVLAVADAQVVAAVDGIPDNTPGEHSRAVPMKVATVLGNYVLLDLGASGRGHRYAVYAHLKPGSLPVKTGDAVRKGQRLGAIGNSGNSDGPRLHFHVTEAADSDTAALRSEGVPFMLDAFTVVAHDPEQVSKRARLTPLGPHQAALPVEGDVVRFEPAPRASLFAVRASLFASRERA